MKIIIDRFTVQLIFSARDFHTRQLNIHILIESDGGTGPMMSRQPATGKVPIPAELLAVSGDKGESHLIDPLPHPGRGFIFLEVRHEHRNAGCTDWA
jgi:hypothetical protein